jgi:FkbM family methyltransferase
MVQVTIVRNPLNLIRPEYLYQPRQALKRINPTMPDGDVTVKLPWGHPLIINPHELIGGGIWTYGIFDLPVVETLWRLTDKEDLAVDVGANIGQMTSLLATRARKVMAFEPHPILFQRLKENLASWKVTNTSIHELAVSSKAGAGYLSLPDSFQQNEGTATLGKNGISVKIITLRDTILDLINVLKVDVEGHELDVLQDVSARDLVFEEHRDCPTPVTEYLLAKGYAIFHLSCTLTSLRLTKISDNQKYAGWKNPNYLATLDPARALKRLKKRGWQSLTG